MPQTSERIVPRTVLALGIGAAIVPALLGAQEMRTLESSRQLRDSMATSVHVRYAAGRLSMRPSNEAQLYRMELRYDPDRVEPIHDFDATARRLELGVRTDHVSLGRGMKDGSMCIELARGVPLDLSLDIGAANADLDLGGLSLESLHLHSGASESTIRFDTPNPQHMRRLAINSGAASFHALHLANANTPTVSVDAGVGGVDLDFGGVWTQDIDLDLQIALGGTTVHAPRDVGVRVELDRAFASFDHLGMEKRGRAWISENWDRASHHLVVRGSAAFGKLTLDHR